MAEQDESNGTVVSLEAKRREPKEKVVELLEDWLTLAKRGELRGLAISGHVEDRDNKSWCRYGVAGLDDMDAAGLCDQQSFMLRHDVMATMREAQKVERDDGEDEPEGEGE